MTNEVTFELGSSGGIGGRAGAEPAIPSSPWLPDIPSVDSQQNFYWAEVRTAKLDCEAFPYLNLHSVVRTLNMSGEASVSAFNGKSVPWATDGHTVKQEAWV